MVFRFSAEGRLTYANRTLCAYYGRDTKEIFGIPVLTPIDPDERDQLWTKVRALTPPSPPSRSWRTPPRARDPTADSAACNAGHPRHLLPHGGGLAYQAVGEDITRESDLEARLMQAQRMEAIGTAGRRRRP